MFRFVQTAAFAAGLLFLCPASASVVIINPGYDFNPVDLALLGEREFAEGSQTNLAVQANFDPSKIITVIPIDETAPPIGEIEWTFELLAAPTGMTITAGGQLEWIGQLGSPTGVPTGNIELRATATEQNTQRSWSDTIDTWYRVLPLAPRVGENPTHLYYDAGILQAEGIYIYDADDTIDGEQLQFSIIDGPPGCHITDHALIYWTPPIGAVGEEFQLNLKVTDGNEHGQGPSLVNIVLHVNEPPAGAEMLDSIYRNAPGFGSAITRDAKRLVVGADQYSQVFIYEPAPAEETSEYNPVDWRLTETLTGLPLTIEDGSEYILKEITPKAFGASAAIDGEWLLVGAPMTDIKTIPHGDSTREPILAAGAAFFYRRDSATAAWQLHQVVFDRHNSYSDSYQFFGGSVAMEAGFAAVSNDSADRTKGEATIYMYNPDTDLWDRQRVIDGYDISLSSGDYFSYPLAIDGATLAVAANEDDSAGFNAGAVYLFDMPVAYPVTPIKILPQNPQTFALFGEALALWGDWLAVAAPNADQLAGKVELWRRQPSGDWTYEHTLSEPGTLYYGRQLSFKAGTLAVASPSLQHNEIDYRGRIYIYAYDGSQWVRKLEHRQPDYQTDANFAHRIALAPDARSLGVTSLGSKLVYDLSLSEGDFPAEITPASLNQHLSTIDEAAFLKTYQSDACYTRTAPISQAASISIDSSRLTYLFPERTNASGYGIHFEFSHDLTEWFQLETYERGHSTRTANGWLRRITIERPDGSQPYFIRQSLSR